MPRDARARELHEHHRLLGRLLAGLGGVLGVVEPDPEDRPRARDGGEQGDVGERVLLAVGGGACRRRRGGRARSRRRRRRRVAAHLPRALGAVRGQKGGQAHGGASYFRLGFAPLLVLIDNNGRTWTSEPSRLPRSRRPRPTGRSRTRRAPCSTCSSSTCPTRRCSSRTSTAATTCTGSSTRAGGESFGLQANQATPLRDSYCGRWPRTWARAAATTSPATRSTRASTSSSSSAPSPTSASRSSCRTARASAASPRCRARPARFTRRRRAAVRRARPRALLRARARELDARPAADVRDAARARARARRARPRDQGAGRQPRRAARPSAAPPARSPPPRSRSCSSRPGREFVSTAMVGVDIAPVTIQPRPRVRVRQPRLHLAPELLRRRRARPPGARRAAGGGDRRALGAVRAGAARRPDRRRADPDLAPRGRRRSPTPSPTCSALLAAQAAVAIEREELRSRVGALALSDPLTGLPTRRTWDDELPRELARARRSRGAGLRSPSSTSTT